MWYYKLLFALISKVKQADQEQADSFLISFISEINRQFPESVPPQVCLGLIDKMYRKYGQVADDSIAVSKFTSDLFALGIILSKATEDEAVYVEDFKKIYQDPEKLRILGFSADIPTISQVKDLEIKQLIVIGYNVSPDLNHILQILNHQNEQNINIELIIYFSNLMVESKLFDDFLSQVYAQYRSNLNHLSSQIGSAPKVIKKRKYDDTRDKEDTQPDKRVGFLNPYNQCLFLDSQRCHYPSVQPKRYISRKEFIQISPIAFFEGQQYSKNCSQPSEEVQEQPPCSSQFEI